ncbi:MAG: hypothetical protein VB862_10285, partial [Pirellulaceae bacterium]
PQAGMSTGGGGGGRPGGGGGPPDADQIVTFVMNRLDTDMDGEISTEEIDASSNPDRTRASDTNQDGTITRDEMLEAIKARISSGGGRSGAGGTRPSGASGRPGGGDSGNETPNESSAEEPPEDRGVFGSLFRAVGKGVATSVGVPTGQ